VGNFHTSNGNFEFRHIFVVNESSNIWWSEKTSKDVDSLFGNKPWENYGEGGTDESCESNEIVMWQVNCIKNLSPILDWLVVEHVNKILGDLETVFASFGFTQFQNDRRVGW